VYLGHVIGGGKLKVDLANIKAILKWHAPISSIKVIIFVGKTKHLRNSISSSLAMVAPFNAIATSGKSF
jgi:hypothetical protein